MSAGYASALFVINGNTIISLWFLVLCLAALYALLKLVLRLCWCWPNCGAPRCPRSYRLTSRLVYKLHYFLIWNGTIRLMTELYIDAALFSFLNLSEVAWHSDFTSVSLSNWLSVLASVVSFIMPITLFAYVSCRQSMWTNKLFQMTVGSFLEGTNLNKKFHKRSILFVPSFFFLRRMLLALTLVFCQ